ncbi:Fc.00g001270.m01.CDS01 [Cosmosporella sp. VM-42]
MDALCSCFGGRSSLEEREREPLLPRYNDETTLQTRLHEKLHTYQMLRAISKGYMPTNEQVITHLRTLLSADILNPEAVDLSDSGRALVRSTKLWLQQFIQLLQHKNAEDQIQDFIWYLTKARLDVDVQDISARAARSRVKADATATYKSLQTVGQLLLTNSDFRIFLSDLGTVGREVLRDTASTLADVSKDAAQKLDPSQESQDALKHANGANGSNGKTREAPSNEDLQENLTQVTQAVADGAGDVLQEAGHSLTEHVQGEEQDALIHRLKQTVVNLRQNTDYSQSVSTLSLLVRRYLMIYSHAAADAMQAVEDDTQTNPEADRGLHNFWLLVTSFGDREKWADVERAFNKIVEDGRADPNFDELVKQLGNMIQDMLTDPDFFENAEERFKELRAKSSEITGKSSVRDDLDNLLARLHEAYVSVIEDEDVKRLIRTTDRIVHLLSPAGQYTNGELVTDSISVFAPMIISAIQFIPIPRVEVATPAIDLLLENLILEPGTTINHTSFLPYKLNISTQNDVEVRKARMRVTTSMKSLVNVKISGMSIRADDLGFWLRLHSGLFRMIDEGIAGFHLDQRGVDISLDLEICRERLEQIVTLRNVNVHIHHLNYKLSKSKFACLAWLFKPIIRPIVRKALEIKIATGIAEGLHFLNRELLFARERLRATRIANPTDLWTFLRAVAARLTPVEDPDVEARVGVKPGGGVFRGRYAPGSLVRMWEEEGRMAEQRVYEYERTGWKNEIFDVRTTAV